MPSIIRGDTDSVLMNEGLGNEVRVYNARCAAGDKCINTQTKTAHARHRCIDCNHPIHMICGLAVPGKPDVRICFVCNEKKASTSPTYQAINDMSNYVPNEEYFKLLQDPGIEMGDDERRAYDEKKKKPKKNRHITFVYRYHRSLYDLAKQLYGVYAANKGTHFPDLTGNESNAVHQIGIDIASLRRVSNRSEIFPESDPQSFLLISKPEYSDLQQFYVLDQKEVLLLALERWGRKNSSDAISYTDADRVRAMFIMFGSDDMRDKIPYLQKSIPNTNKSNSRLLLDEFKQQKKLTMNLLKNKFIDMEEKAAFPVKWHERSTREKLDQKHGDGAWERFTKEMDPNKEERIQLAWTQDHIEVMIKHIVMEYNKVMFDYQKNTGGGSGDEALFVDWEEREETRFFDYDHKIKNNVYLTAIHMYDKQFGFPLTLRVDTIDQEYAIDDDDTTTKITRTPSPHPPDVDNATKEKKELFQKLNDTVTALFAMSSNRTKEELQSDLIDNINKTLETINKFETEKNSLKRKAQRDNVKNNPPKRRQIFEKYKEKKKMIIELEKTVAGYREKLASLNKSGNEEEKGEDDDDSFSSIEE